jgi:hypothetical protein
MAGSNVDVDFVNKHEKKATKARNHEKTILRVFVFFVAGSWLLWLFDRMNADESAARAVILEFHTSRDLGKECVVLTETNIQSRPEAASTLPHENRSAGHDVAVVPLHAQSL